MTAHLHIHEELRDRFKRYCKERGTTMKDMVARLIEREIAPEPPPKKKLDTKRAQAINRPHPWEQRPFWELDK